MALDEHAEALAARQSGAFSRAQARLLGAGDAEIDSRVRSGRWQRVAPGVLSFPGHPPTWQRRLWIAHLHAGPASAVSHEAAGATRGFTQVPRGRVSLIVPRGRNASPVGVRWHRLDDLGPGDVSSVRGLPVTTPARTALDLAGRLRPTSLGLLLEQGVLEHRFTLAEVGAVLARTRRKGKPGVRRLESALDELGPGDDLPRTQLERLLDRVVELAGLPAPRHEHPLPNLVGLTGFVDRCWPEAKLIAEGDGRRWHARRAQLALDADRDLEAMRCGYTTSRLHWERLDGDAHGTARALRDVYVQRFVLLHGHPPELPPPRFSSR